MFIIDVAVCAYGFTALKKLYPNQKLLGVEALRFALGPHFVTLVKLLVDADQGSLQVLDAPDCWPPGGHHDVL